MWITSCSTVVLQKFVAASLEKLLAGRTSVENPSIQLAEIKIREATSSSIRGIDFMNLKIKLT
jgi:hypothetical protein